MSALSLVRKARRSVANSIRQIENLQETRKDLADLADTDSLDYTLWCLSCHVERRLKHHIANIARLQAFATLDPEQAAGFLSWFDSARVVQQELPIVATTIPELSFDDELDDLIAKLGDPLPAADVRRPTRYEAILHRLGFGNGVAA